MKIRKWKILNNTCKSIIYSPKGTEEDLIREKKKSVMVIMLRHLILLMRIIRNQMRSIAKIRQHQIVHIR